MIVVNYKSYAKNLTYMMLDLKAKEVEQIQMIYLHP